MSFWFESSLDAVYFRIALVTSDNASIRRAVKRRTA